MASMAPPEKYEEDAARIERDYVSSSSTTRAEIEADLKSAGFPAKAQSHIEGWLVTSDDVMDDAGQWGGAEDPRAAAERHVRSETGGAVDEARARSIADEAGGEVAAARKRATQNVDKNGVLRAEDGFEPIGKPRNLEEEVRGDGIYYRHKDSGKTKRAARFER